MTNKSKKMNKSKVLPFAELHKIAVNEARKIHRAKVEHGIAIDGFGNIEKYIGDIDGVEIPPYTLKNSKIIIHNHPHDYKEPSSFSGDDVYNLLHYKSIDEIIVCGYGYYFYMRDNNCMDRAIDIKHLIINLYDNTVIEQNKKYMANTGLSITEMKIKYREMVIQLEIEFHKKLLMLSSEKRLSYGKCKL